MPKFTNQEDSITHEYDYLNIINDGNDSFSVKSVKNNGYPSHSVLAGQDMIRFITSFDTLEEAQAKYPSADCSHELLMPQNSFDHLPDDTDY
jgi:hypothetical protein